MEVELMRESDMINENPPILDAMTHLGGIIKEGDYVEGYDLQLLSSINEDIDNNVSYQKYLRKHKPMDVVIINKHYSKRLHHSKRRWKLKSLVKDREYVNDKYTQAKEMNDREEFMRELEEDFDMRCRINIYKKDKDETKSNISDMSDIDEEEEEVPQIPYVLLKSFFQYYLLLTTTIRMLFD